MAIEKSSITAEMYRQYLVEAVKTAGQMLIDNAENAVGNSDNISDFSIRFDFEQDYESIPKMTVMRSHLPKYEVIDNLLEKRYEITKESSFSETHIELDKRLTCRELLAKEHPDDIDDSTLGGCHMCPHNYGYLNPYDELCEIGKCNCDDCWDQIATKYYDDKENSHG